MNCLRSLERWDRGFESHSRHWCLRVRLFYVCVVLCVCSGLATGWSLSKESYRLCKKRLRNWRRGKAHQKNVEPLMNKWLNGWMNDWMDGWVIEWMDEWMNEWLLNEWMIEWRVQVIKLLIMHFSNLPSPHLSSVKIFSSTLCSRTPSVCSLKKRA
jgi:hypothetical protein